jgi:hypothetical protein
MITYGKVVTEVENPDGSITLRDESYYAGKKGKVIERIREDIRTNKTDYFKDVVTALGIIKTDTPEVTISIKKDDRGDPHLIQRTYIVLKENN